MQSPKFVSVQQVEMFGDASVERSYDRTRRVLPNRCATRLDAYIS
jgi:hypothetical protein